MRGQGADGAAEGTERGRGAMGKERADSADVVAGVMAAGAGSSASAAKGGGGSEGARAKARIPTIEAVFEQYGHYAVWKNDVTEVALWSADTKDFSDFYEVARMDNTYYFRSIPHLTRPVLTHGVPADCPLMFTETVEQRQQWLNDVRKENWRMLSEGARNSFGPAQGTVAPPSGH